MIITVNGTPMVGTAATLCTEVYVNLVCNDNLGEMAYVTLLTPKQYRRVNKRMRTSMGTGMTATRHYYMAKEA